MFRVNNRYRRNNPGLEQAIIGTELLRLAGGPNRGWYPTRKANQPRPASIEHLERLNNAYDPRLAGSGDQRKPLTLPTNITPNKYFGQSKHSSASSTREALRRVTSLLIKKGKRWNLRYYKSPRSWNQWIVAAIVRPLESTMRLHSPSQSPFLGGSCLLRENEFLSDRSDLRTSRS